MGEQTVFMLRGYGMMFDDRMHPQEPQVERALELLPPDLAAGRYRRLMRAAELNYRKGHLPVEEQNYDPMIPYLAPFMEEAKFQMQEEQEHLRYNPWDRRLYSGFTTVSASPHPTRPSPHGRWPVALVRLPIAPPLLSIPVQCFSPHMWVRARTRMCAGSPSSGCRLNSEIAC